VFESVRRWLDGMHVPGVVFGAVEEEVIVGETGA